MLSIRIERIRRYKSVIPKKLKLDRVILQGQEDTTLIFSLFLPVRASSCGGGIFKLSKSTIDAIEFEGLSFFEDALNPRGKKYEYAPWKKTPVPYTWTSNGAWPGLNCINKNTKLVRKITKISELPGSFYTDLGNNKVNKTVLVFPELGFVIFTYVD